METEYCGEEVSSSRVNNLFIGGQDRTLGGGRVWRSQPWTKSSGDITKPWLSDTLTTKPQILNTTRRSVKRKEHPRLSDDVYNSLNALDVIINSYDNKEGEEDDDDDDDESFIEAVHAPKSYVTQVAAMDVIVRNAGKNMLVRRSAVPEDPLMITYVNHKDYIEVIKYPSDNKSLRSVGKIATTHALSRSVFQLNARVAEKLDVDAIDVWVLSQRQGRRNNLPELRSIPTSHSMGEITNGLYGTQNAENEYGYAQDLPYPSPADHAEKVSNPESGYITNDQDSIDSDLSSRLLMKINPNSSVSSYASGLTNASLAEEPVVVKHGGTLALIANGEYSNAGLTSSWSHNSLADSGSTVTEQNLYYANSEETVYDSALPKKHDVEEDVQDVDVDRISQSSGAFDTDLDDLQNGDNQSSLTIGTAGTVHRNSSNARRSDVISFVQLQTVETYAAAPPPPPTIYSSANRFTHKHEDLTPTNIRPSDENIPAHPGFEYPSDPYSRQSALATPPQKIYDKVGGVSLISSFQSSSPIYSTGETPRAFEPSATESAFPFPVKLRRVGEPSSVRSHSSVYSSKSVRSKMSNSNLAEDNSSAVQRELIALPLPPAPPILNYMTNVQKSSSSSSQMFEDNQAIYMMPTSPAVPIVSTAAVEKNRFELTPKSDGINNEESNDEPALLVSPAPYHTYVPETYNSHSLAVDSSPQGYDESIYQNSDEMNLTPREPSVETNSLYFASNDAEVVSNSETLTESYAEQLSAIPPLPSFIPPLPSFIPPPPPSFIPPPPPSSFSPLPAPLDEEAPERESLVYSSALAWQGDPERRSLDEDLVSQISDSELLSSSFAPPPPAPPPPGPPPPCPPAFLGTPVMNKSKPIVDATPPESDEKSFTSAILAVKLRRTETSENADGDSTSSEDRRSFMRVPPEADPVTNLVAEMFNKGFKLRPTSNGQKLRQSSIDTGPGVDDVYANAESLMESQTTSPSYVQRTASPTVKSPPPTAAKPKPPTAVKASSSFVETVAQKNDSAGGALTSKPSFGKGNQTNGKNGANNGTTIDVTTLPGYVSIPDDCPPWKRAMLEKKNKQLEEDAKKQELEQEKWKDIPAWKRNLMAEKDKKMQNDKADEPGAIKIEPKWKGQFTVNR